MIHFFFLIVSVVLTIFSISIGRAQDIKPTPKPAMSAASIATPVPTTKDSLMSLEEIDIVNKRFADFLNGEGDFTDENIHEMIFYYPGEKNRDLGFIAAYESQAFIQGVLLYNQDVYMGQDVAIGVKDRDGNRVIIVCENPFRFFEDASDEFPVIQYRGNVINDNDDCLYLSRQDINEYYKNHIGRVGKLEMIIKEQSRPGYDEAQKNLAKNMAMKSEINRKTITSMLFSEPYDNGYNSDWINSKGPGLEGITDIESFWLKILEADRLPSFITIGFFDYPYVAP